MTPGENKDVWEIINPAKSEKSNDQKAEEPEAQFSEDEFSDWGGSDDGKDFIDQNNSDGGREINAEDDFGSIYES